MSEITTEEKFLFDLQGYLLLESVLTPEECSGYLKALARLHEQEFSDEWINDLPDDIRKFSMPTREDRIPGQVRYNGLPRLDQAFDSVIAHPKIMPYLRAFTDRPQLINTWSIEKVKGSDTGTWHRGVPPTEYSCRQNIPRSRMLNVVFFLTDNGREDGCVVAVPGSHKNNIDLKWMQYQNLEMPGSIAVTGKAGDVFMFSEAVVHNGLPKTTDGVRSNLYFNYTSFDFNVMIYEPHNNHHFCLPPEVRERFTPEQKEVTRWMQWARS